MKPFNIKRAGTFIRGEPVLAAALVCALISVFFVPPDNDYLNYIYFKTLLCLFCLMASLKGFEREGILSALSVKLASGVKNIRALTFMLVFICFFSSMLITNDVALIAFVPVTLAVFSMYGFSEHSVLAVILQTLAANIGSSLTPIGNPQNLYLFVRYPFTIGSFLQTTLPFVLFGGLLLAIVCLFVPNLPVCRETPPPQTIRKKPAAAYCAMFIIAVTAVSGLIPYQTAAVIIAAAVFLIDRRTFIKIDYSLLLTFVVIFVFVGNIARIDFIHGFISYWAQKDCLLTAAVSSQFISNVPAAVMLSEFTEDSHKLLLGVSVGGMGTLIASMASVISYRLYAAANKSCIRRYIGLFTVLNLIFLILSAGFARVFMG